MGFFGGGGVRPRIQFHAAFLFTGLVMQVSKQNILQTQGKQKVQLALTVIKHVLNMMPNRSLKKPGGKCGVKHTAIMLVHSSKLYLTSAFGMDPSNWTPFLCRVFLLWMGK
jgi:hypothetical protein